jgi:hypothetical protein
MKRIKLFEERQWKTEDYYIKSTDTEFQKSRIVSFEVMWERMMNRWGFDFEVEEVGKSKKKFVISTDSNLVIYQTQDYYFWALIEEEKDVDYYRCDQIDGLERLLKDKKLL